MSQCGCLLSNANIIYCSETHYFWHSVHFCSISIQPLSESSAVIGQCLWHHNRTEVLTARLAAQFLNTSCAHFSVDWTSWYFTVQHLDLPYYEKKTGNLTFYIMAPSMSEMFVFLIQPTCYKNLLRVNPNESEIMLKWNRCCCIYPVNQ